MKIIAKKDMPADLKLYKAIRMIMTCHESGNAEECLATAEAIEKKSGIELFDEFYTLQNGQPLNEEQRAFAEEVLESLKEGMV